MRRLLNGLYRLSGGLAALCFVLMGLLVVAQIVSRLMGAYIPSADDIAAMFLAAGSFLALAYTLRHGGHIRASLLLQNLPERARWPAEVFCLLVGTVVTGWMAYYMIQSIYYSWLLNDYTIGAVPIPKWIPQIGMGLGFSVLFIAFLDDLVAVLRRRPTSYSEHEFDPRSASGDVINE